MEMRYCKDLLRDMILVYMVGIVYADKRRCGVYIYIRGNI
jgi:hypothetical protein